MHPSPSSSVNSITWDKKPRVDRLFIDYLGAENNLYTKEGIGKSHLINLLGKDWYSDSINTVQGKEAYEQLQEAWIVEMAELSAVRKVETEAVKHFVSKREDVYRVAYGRRVEKFKRQCVFFGTTNEESFLKDRNGNRRFWPIKVLVQKIKKSVFKDLNKYEIDNIWAEAMELYKIGEKLILEGEVAKTALSKQQEHLEERPREGMVIEYLDMLLPKCWDRMDIYARRKFIAEGDYSEFEPGTELRKKVCAMEIWVELFNGDPKLLTYAQAREINDILRQVEGWKGYEKSKGRLIFGKIYGAQRAFIRADEYDDVD